MQKYKTKVEEKINYNSFIGFLSSHVSGKELFHSIAC